MFCCKSFNDLQQMGVSNFVIFPNISQFPNDFKLKKNALYILLLEVFIIRLFIAKIHNY